MTSKLTTENSLYHRAGDGAAQYLLRNINFNGTFNYIFDPEKGPKINGYNMLRHAGSLYSLFQWFNLYNKWPASDILDKGVNYLTEHVNQIGEAKHIAAIVHHSEAKLGGSALALLMLTERYKHKRSARDMQMMSNLAEFILWMQEFGGKFRSKYMVSEGSFDKFESLYYPGEAILSLIRLYLIDKDARWLNAAKDGAHFLVRHPVMRGKIREHNHWFAIALSELYLIEPQEAYLLEFWNIVDTIIKYIPKRMQQGYTSAGMATLGEAVVAGLVMELKLQRTDKIDRLLSTIDNVLAYCLRLQVKKNDFENEAVQGGIMQNVGKTSIRIDYVQHTLQVISGRLAAEAYRL